jgi:hypothetical protein
MPETTGTPGGLTRPHADEPVGKRFETSLPESRGTPTALDLTTPEGTVHLKRLEDACSPGRGMTPC